jgi:hypothetical protein
MILDTGPTFFSHTSRYLAITSNQIFLDEIKDVLDILSVDNFATLNENRNEVLVNGQTLNGKLEDIFEANHVREQSHKVLIVEPYDDLNVSFDGKKLQHTMLHFFRAVEKFENCQILVTRVKIRDMEQVDSKLKSVEIREYGMFLNVIHDNVPGPRFMTYNVQGYCPIVPIKEIPAWLKNIFLRVRNFYFFELRLSPG